MRTCCQAVSLKNQMHRIRRDGRHQRTAWGVAALMPTVCVQNLCVFFFAVYLRVNKEMIHQFTSCAPPSPILPSCLEGINQLSDTSSGPDTPVGGGEVMWGGRFHESNWKHIPWTCRRSAFSLCRRRRRGEMTSTVQRRLSEEATVDSPSAAAADGE